jgi:hypothetical protein
MSTREMGPRYRHDTIDDHAAAWNWHKIMKLGTLSASIWNLMLRSIHRRCTFNSIPDSSSYVGKAPSAFLKVQFQFLTACNVKVGRDGQALGEGFDVPESVRGVRFWSALWISNLREFLHVT